MSSQFETSNPFASSAVASYAPPQQREQAPASVLAAGMALIAVSGLGLAITIYNFVLSFGAAHIDPNAPEFVRQIQQGAVGPVATAIQGTFILVNLFIIICGIQMMQLKSWGMAVAGSIVAMLNLASCCCVAGIPVGLWSLSVLMSPDVISIFSAAQTESQ